MDNHYIDYFLEIARRKSLSKAADYLFVTQSSLSQFLSKEEKRLGVQLVIRDKKELKLTYAGELYKKTCEEILASQEHLYKELADLESSKTGITKIGITPQWGGMVMAKILSSFRQRYPNAALKFIETTARPLMNIVSENIVDLALIALPEDEVIHYQHDSIYQEELFLAVPESYITDPTVQSVVSLSTFKDWPFIISMDRTVLREITNSMFRAADFIPKVTCEINNHLASLEMVSNNLGITVVPKCYTLPYKNVRYLAIKPHWHWNISIVIRRGYELSKSDEYLIQLLKEYYQAL